MQLTFLHGYPDYIGKRFAFVGYGSGPTSLPAAGDVISFPRYDNYIDHVVGGTTPDGAFTTSAQPSAVGPRATWYLIWKFATAGSVASVAQNAAGTGMTPGTYTVLATGGGGSGASASVVVATATTLGAITVTPGKNYTSAPTFTLVAGGTSATLTATLSAIGAVVATGANLSTEQVQVAGFGGVY